MVLLWRNQMVIQRNHHIMEIDIFLKSKEHAELNLKISGYLPLQR